jgi:hypothetical protein
MSGLSNKIIISQEDLKLIQLSVLREKVSHIITGLMNQLPLFSFTLTKRNFLKSASCILTVNFVMLFALSLPGQQIQNIRLEFSQESWQDSLLYFKESGSNRRIPGNVLIDGIKFEDVGIRYKGNSSFNGTLKLASKKLPFNLKADYKGKKQAFPNDITTLKLSNHFRDPSYIREALAYRIASQYMPVPYLGYAHVWANDEYVGFYNVIESIDKNYVKKLFKFSPSALFKCDPDFNAMQTPGCAKSDYASLQYLGESQSCYENYYEIKSRKGWDDLIQLSRIVTQNPEQIEDILNIDATLWWLALNNILVNLDSYLGIFCHNYYLVKEPSGLFQTLLWDLNLSFGGFAVLGKGKSLDHIGMINLSPIIHYKERNHKRPLIVQLLKNKRYRKIYYAHYRTILEENFINQQYLAWAHELQNKLSDEVAKDRYSPYFKEDFKDNLYHKVIQHNKRSIPGIADLMQPRVQYLESHPLLNRERPQIKKTEYHQVNTEMHFTTEVSGAQMVSLFWRNSSNEAFTEQAMEMNETTGFWELQLDSVKQYYIMAETDQAVSFSPARAAFEYYIID